MARRWVVQRPLAREHLNAKLVTQRVEELRTRKLLGLGANFFVNERRGRDSNPRNAEDAALSRLSSGYLKPLRHPSIGPTALSPVGPTFF